jgi:hypothetical protein
MIGQSWHSFFFKSSNNFDLENKKNLAFQFVWIFFVTGYHPTSI